jgi:hypothetical protein
MSEVKNQVREDLEEVLRCAEYTRTPQLSTGDEYNRLYELRTIVVNRVTRVLAALSAEPVDDRVGKWLSAALEDPTTCAEMRADIEAWFAARAEREA